MLQTYSVMPLDTEHLEEICNDIKNQYESGIASCPLFKMTLVPEGNPPIDKAKIMCEQYALFKKKLSEDNIPSGILVQASIGHGWKLSEPFPYQRFTPLNDGKPQEIVCPYDEGFRDYIYNTLKTVASYSPCHIMIDDDLRLIGRGSHGCGCPLHIKRFNELAKTNFTGEELDKIISCGAGKNLTDIYIETQKESLIGAAKAMRAGIDSVNPSIPGSYCCVGNNAEFAYEIASILAGESNPVTVRINNGNYTAGGARFLTAAFQRAAAQIEKLKGKADIILAETDTCPQNRYSTGAMQLHSHFTGTILEGAKGAKHWITRLSAFEPESGIAYRKILAKYNGFYEALAEIVPELEWLGCRIPVNDKPVYHFSDVWDASVDGHNAWSSCVLERLGLPMYFSSAPGGVLCLEDEVFLSDEQLMKAFEKPMLIASDSAIRLIQRGFGKYIGVYVREHIGNVPSVEKAANGNIMPVQKKIKELVPGYKTEEISEVYHTVDNKNFEKLFPGITKYKNELGGTIFVFCGTPNTNYHISEAFSFLNYTRKQQLIEMLQSTDSLPLYYPNDEEVYLRAANTKDGKLFTAIFNIGLDPIEKLELVCSRKITEISKLTPTGEKEKIDFSEKDDKLILDCPCNTLEPAVLFLG